MIRRCAWLGLALAAATGCDRNVEPYVPGEQPRQPDLSAIFPEGAERRAAPGVPAAPGEADPGDAPPIRGVVEISDELRDRAPEGAVLFLIARPGEAGPPLAVQRIAAPSFPLSFEIGPGDRMIATLPFAGELRLTARLDSDGDAASRSPGDLLGRAPGVHVPGATGVRIVLDELL